MEPRDPAAGVFLLMCVFVLFSVCCMGEYVDA